ELFSAALAYLTPERRPMPYLAEVLPSLEAGSWRVFTDGQMETVYRLRGNAAWHDGKPVTAGDFVFGHHVRQDPDVPSTKSEIDRRLTSIQAADDQTLVMRWGDIYIWGGMVSGPNFPALPRHALESVYNGD